MLLSTPEMETPSTRNSPQAWTKIQGKGHIHSRRVKQKTRCGIKSRMPKEYELMCEGYREGRKKIWPVF
jgi:hypothetical protein